MRKLVVERNGNWLHRSESIECDILWVALFDESLVFLCGMHVVMVSMLFAIVVVHYICKTVWS